MYTLNTAGSTVGTGNHSSDVASEIFESHLSMPAARWFRHHHSRAQVIFHGLLHHRWPGGPFGDMATEESAAVPHGAVDSAQAGGGARTAAQRMVFSLMSCQSKASSFASACTPGGPLSGVAADEPAALYIGSCYYVEPVV